MEQNIDMDTLASNGQRLVCANVEIAVSSRGLFNARCISQRGNEVAIVDITEVEVTAEDGQHVLTLFSDDLETKYVLLTKKFSIRSTSSKMVTLDIISMSKKVRAQFYGDIVSINSAFEVIEICPSTNGLRVILSEDFELHPTDIRGLW